MERAGWRRRPGRKGGADDRAPVEILDELAGRPITVRPHDPFRLGGDDDGRIVGGYRVLRLLGRGSRADVYLGRLPTWAGPAPSSPSPAAARAARPASPPRADTGAGDTTTGVSADPSADTFGLPAEVALKVFHAGTSAQSVDRELAALAAATSPHVVRLLDVASIADGPTCVVLERCAGGSLSALLQARERILPGEAVTVLAPILQALGSMHRAGFTHGSLRLSSVLFDAVGTPVVVGWGHGEELLDDRGRPPGAERLAAAPAIRVDLGRFAAVATAVLGRVDGASRSGRDNGGDEDRDEAGAADRLAATIARIAARPDPDTEERLTDALFDFADPLPVSLPAPGAALRSAPDRRAASTTGRAMRRGGPADRDHGGAQRDLVAPPPTARRRQGRHRDARPRTSGGSGTGGGKESAESTEPKEEAGAVRGSHRGGVAARVLDDLRRVRRPVWLAVALAGLALVAAALLLPARLLGERDSGPAATVDPASVEALPTAAATSTEDPAIHALEETLFPVITGDDPAAAASALLRLRAECLRARSESCLAGVDQPGSVALAADRAVLREPGGAAASGVPTADAQTSALPRLVQHLGGSAIVSVPAALLGDAPPETPPASLLMVRSEAGWRIRDVL